MLGIGNGDLERFIIMVVVLTILAMAGPVDACSTARRLAPQVPPTVSPLLHPLDEDVRGLKHFARQRRTEAAGSRPCTHDPAGRPDSSLDPSADIAEIKTGHAREDGAHGAGC